MIGFQSRKRQLKDRLQISNRSSCETPFFQNELHSRRIGNLIFVTSKGIHNFCMLKKLGFVASGGSY